VYFEFVVALIVLVVEVLVIEFASKCFSYSYSRGSSCSDYKLVWKLWYKKLL